MSDVRARQRAREARLGADPAAAAQVLLAEYLRRGGRDPRLDPRQGDRVACLDGTDRQVYGLGRGSSGTIHAVWWRCGSLHSMSTLEVWGVEARGGVVLQIASTDVGELHDEVFGERASHPEARPR